MKKVRKDLQELTAKVNMYWVNTMIDHRPILYWKKWLCSGMVILPVNQNADFAHAQLCVLRKWLGDLERSLLVSKAHRWFFIWIISKIEKINLKILHVNWWIFTLGRGHYSENDVKNTARALLVGLRIGKMVHLHLIKHHDSGTKPF